MKSILLETRIIVTSPFPCNSLTSSKTCSVDWGSNPKVGSSNTITFGSSINIPAKVTFLFWPPDNLKGEELTNSSGKESSESISFAFSSHLGNSSFCKLKSILGPKIISWRTVSLNNWYSGCWKTIPTSLLIVL